MKFKLRKFNKNITDEQLVADLKRTAKALGTDTLTHRDYDVHGKYSSDACRYRFGSWNEAVKLAGLRRTKIFGLTEEELFENLMKVWTRLGRQPFCREMNDRSVSEFSTHVYRYYFGSFRQALEEFVAAVNRDKPPESPAATARAAKRKRNRTKRHVPYHIRFKILTRDDFTCVKCGASPALVKGVKLEVDHIKPYSRGGETRFSNLQTLCRACNRGKGTCN